MWHTMTTEETEKKFKTNQNYGLSDQEAKKRLLENGENKLKESRKKSRKTKRTTSKTTRRT